MTRPVRVSHVASIVETLRTSLMRATGVPWVLCTLRFTIGWLGVTMPGSP